MSLLLPLLLLLLLLCCCGGGCSSSSSSSNPESESESLMSEGEEEENEKGNADDRGEVDGKTPRARNDDEEEEEEEEGENSTSNSLGMDPKQWRAEGGRMGGGRIGDQGNGRVRGVKRCQQSADTMSRKMNQSPSQTSGNKSARGATCLLLQPSLVRLAEVTARTHCQSIAIRRERSTGQLAPVCSFALMLCALRTKAPEPKDRGATGRQEITPRKPHTARTNARCHDHDGHDTHKDSTSECAGCGSTGWQPRGFGGWHGLTVRFTSLQGATGSSPGARRSCGSERHADGCWTPPTRAIHAR
jgi:hypothetical protein